MAGGYPIRADVANANSAGISAGNGTALTCGTASYGSYVQLIASTPYDTSWLLLSYGSMSASFNNNNYITIGIGAAGSEVGLISDLYLSFGGHGALTFPLQIPAGTRIAAKAYGDGGADTMMVSIVLFDSAIVTLEGCGGVESIVGAPPNITSTLSGTGSYGSWVQVKASTSRDYVGLMPILIGANGNNLSTKVVGAVGIGAAGSEISLVSDFAYWQASGSSQDQPFPVIPVSIPAGSRVAVQSMFPTGSTTVRFACMGLF
jgi:hypothetical protein